jgi:hypothetical protein
MPLTYRQAMARAALIFLGVFLAGSLLVISAVEWLARRLP